MSSRGPLPFCSQCVKALVYFDVQACRLDIGNEKGDTPLHIAARWGYQGIIETLLQNGASTEIQNRLKETPLKCALNSKVAVFLSERQYDLKKNTSIRRSGLCRAIQTALVPKAGMCAYSLRCIPCLAVNEVHAVILFSIFRRSFSQCPTRTCSGRVCL